MTKILKSSVIFFAVFILLVSGISCAKKTAAPAAATKTATVTQGNLIVTTSVDGNLVMPQAYNLLFGAAGNVQDVFVQEGDFVKEGTVLATLDNTSQRLGVESSNNNVQQVLSKLYENVPLLPQFRTVVYENINSVLSVGLPTTTQQTVLYGLGDTPIPPASGPTTVTSTTTKTQDNYTPTGSLVTLTTTATTTTVGGATLVNDPDPQWAGWKQQITTVTKTVTTLQYISQQKQDPGLNTSSAYYYPNATAMSAFNWAQGEVGLAQQLYQLKGYDAAASQLYLALADLDACIQILEDAINNPK